MYDVRGAPLYLRIIFCLEYKIYKLCPELPAFSQLKNIFFVCERCLTMCPQQKSSVPEDKPGNNAHSCFIRYPMFIRNFTVLPLALSVSGIPKGIVESR